MTLLLELAAMTSENLRLGSSIQFPRLTVWKSPSIDCEKRLGCSIELPKGHAFLSLAHLPTSAGPSLSQDNVVNFQVRPAPPVDQRGPLGPEVGARMGQHVEEHGHLVVRPSLATLGTREIPGLWRVGEIHLISFDFIYHVSHNIGGKRSVNHARGRKTGAEAGYTKPFPPILRKKRYIGFIPVGQTCQAYIVK